VNSVARLVAAAVLVAGTFTLAFFSGGYFAESRLFAAIVAWALFGALALLVGPPLPSSTSGRISLLGLALLAAWTGISIAWAPLKGPALEDFQRLLLYVAVFAVACFAFREPLAAKLLEPLLALGILVVILDGLADRVLPGVFHHHHSVSAGGRLEQPLTYWNAMGAVAAIGFVLSARLAGDPERPTWLRSAAAASTAPLAAGVYLSFSRGALAALAVGLLALIAFAPTRAQLRALVVTVVTGAVAAGASGALTSVRTLEGGLHTRESEGAAMLAILLVLMAVAALAQWYLASREGAGTLSVAPYRISRKAPLYATVAVLAVAGIVVAAVVKERSTTTGTPAFGATSQRLESFQSNRYDYWRVALRAFARHPLWGSGSSGFQVDWLRERTVKDPAKDAHSLYIETAGELGLVGLAALALFIGGAAVAARNAYRARPGLVAGWVAAVLVWAVHAGLDWDWEMPAVSGLALLLGAALIAWSDADGAERTRPPDRARDPARTPQAESHPA
jgi:hypothetical protein